MTTKKNPVVTVAKKATEQEMSRVLSSGVSVRVHPVSYSMIMDAQNQIKFPPVPIIKDEEKGQTYENPDHPAYKRACSDVETQRTMAAMDALIFFGVELVDGMPEDDLWLRKLQTLVRAGVMNLDGFLLDDPIDLEFLYKKYIAVLSEDYEIIQELSGVTEEGIQEIEDSFPGNS